MSNVTRFPTLFVSGAAIALLVAASAVPAMAKSKAEPFEFVGAEGDCGVGYPAGARIVTATWLQGAGLPDNGDDNFNLTDPRDLPSKDDRHEGLLLSKNGPTPVCSAAGARISGFTKIEVTPSTEFGFDIRNGTACGAGAPRFNVTVRVGGSDQTHFLGCAAGVKSPAPQDPTEWTRIRINAEANGIPDGAKVRSILLIFDEGTDTPTAPDNPGGVGLAIIDNIFIDGDLITDGPGK